MFFKIFVLKNFANFTEKQLCLKSYFDKVASLKAFNFIEENLQYRSFPVKFSAKLLTATFLQNTSGGYL